MQNLIGIFIVMYIELEQGLYERANIKMEIALK